MKKGIHILCFLLATAVFGVYGWGQTNSGATSGTPQQSVRKNTSHRGPVKEMAKGGEDIGVGAAKGTGELARGTAQGVGHLVTGNFGSAGASFGKGVGELGKNVAVGTSKGVGKIAKGIGGEIRKL